MQKVIQALLEAALPLIGGGVLVSKFKEQRKLRLLGIALLIFGFLLFAKSIASSAEAADQEVMKVVERLKAGRSFPITVDFATRLDEIKGTQEKEVTYYYTTILDDFSGVDEKGIVDYACKSKDFTTLFEHDYSVVFVYRNLESKEIGRVPTSRRSCK